MKGKENKKKTATSKCKKLVSRLALLLVFLIGRNITKVRAEEVVGTILWEPIMALDFVTGKGTYDKYTLDTQGDLVEDTYMRLFTRDTKGSTGMYFTLSRYLKEGRQVVFENEGLKSNIVDNDRLLAIISNGTTIELTQLFSLDIIKREFPYLYSRLVREGKVN